MSILVKKNSEKKLWDFFSENIDFGKKKKNEILMSVIVVEEFLFGAKIVENSDFCQHFRKLYRF